MNALRGLLFAAALAAAAGAHAATTGDGLVATAAAGLVGTPAPRLVLTTIDGQRLDLGQLYGRRPVYLKFWATWCVPCREQMPHLKRTYARYRRDLEVIAINVGFNDPPAEVAAFRRAVGLQMPVVRDDGTAAAALHLRVTPQHVVIGRDGRILYVGHQADARLEAALSAALAPRAAATVSAAAAPAPLHYAIGERLPTLAAPGIDGAPLAVSDPDAARPTIVVFLSPWCESYLAQSRPAVAAGCRALRERVTEAAATAGTRWVGLASGLWATAEDLRAYRAAHDPGIPLALDASGDLFRAFDVSDLPAAVVVDAQGRLVRRLARADFDTPAAFRAAVRLP
ncbi:MAG: redoxin domain-containing protein [Proteobacteria bacterium]|nr:redoxin domain-containing protein [Pseudomonadota bacterium]